MSTDNKQKGIAAIGKLAALAIILIAVMIASKIYRSEYPKDISDDKDLVIIKVYKDSEIVAQVATVPDKPVSFGSYKVVVFQKRK